MSKFEEKMAQYIKLTEENLLKYNDHTEANAPQKELIDAMNYSLEQIRKFEINCLIYVEYNLSITNFINVLQIFLANGKRNKAIQL